MPRYLKVREARIYIKQPGFRTKEITIVTTLLDPMKYTKEDLANLYLQRWNNELDLRSIKSDMGMECLRCKTPELVRKEIWAHALAYNLIRTIMAQAAANSNLLPRTISFKGALQTLEAFRPVISIVGSHNASTRTSLYQELLQAIVLHRADAADCTRLFDGGNGGVGTREEESVGVARTGSTLLPIGEEIGCEAE